MRSFELNIFPLREQFNTRHCRTKKDALISSNKIIFSYPTRLAQVNIIGIKLIRITVVTRIKDDIGRFFMEVGQLTMKLQYDVSILLPQYSMSCLHGGLERVCMRKGLCAIKKVIIN